MPQQLLSETFERCGTLSYQSLVFRHDMTSCADKIDVSLFTQNAQFEFLLRMQQGYPH